MKIISSQIKTEINASVKLSQKFKFFYFFIKKIPGRDRHGPTGSHPIRREAQDIYMIPAGAMGFKEWIDFFRFL